MQSLLNCLDEEAFGWESKFSFNWGWWGIGGGSFMDKIPKVDRTEKYATRALLGHRITVWEERVLAE